MSEIENHLYAAAAIRNHEGKYLTVFHAKKKEHPWRFPGGKVEVTEAWKKAMLRELKEELNLTATASYFLGPYTSEQDGAVWKGLFYVIDVNDVDLVNLEFMGPEKHTEIQWFTPTELFLLGTDPEFKAAVDAEAEVLHGRLQFSDSHRS